MLSLARVVKVHPESHAVDVEFMDDGRRVAGVQVLSSVAGTDFGSTDLSEPDTMGYGSKQSKTRDIYAVVDFIRDIPVAIGFMFPQVAQCLFKDTNRKVYRHSSDVYYTIDGKGNTEFSHPSGAYVRFGATPEHENLTGKDYDKKWQIKRNTKSKVHIHVEQAGGVASFDIDPSGNITIKAVNIDVTGKMHITGGITSDADVVAGGISLMHHSHSDPQGGKVSPPQ